MPADLTNPIVLDQLIGLWSERYRRGRDLAEKRVAAERLAFYGMMMRQT